MFVIPDVTSVSKDSLDHQSQYYPEVFFQSHIILKDALMERTPFHAALVVKLVTEDDFMLNES